MQNQQHVTVHQVHHPGVEIIHPAPVPFVHAIPAPLPIAYAPQPFMHPLPAPVFNAVPTAIAAQPQRLAYIVTYSLQRMAMADAGAHAQYQQAVLATGLNPLITFDVSHFPAPPPDLCAMDEVVRLTMDGYDQGLGSVLLLIACPGGTHRSVAVGEIIKKKLKRRGVTTHQPAVTEQPQQTWSEKPLYYDKSILIFDDVLHDALERFAHLRHALDEETKGIRWYVKHKILDSLWATRMDTKPSERLIPGLDEEVCCPCEALM
ncbi:hypothetical protein N0V90_002263 [Kalmusia sp. IMI 367209]|nr:hypothetical protein N0V90_002263 [Kalmusia sp. IMI 367209]